MPGDERIDPAAGGFPRIGQPALRALRLVGVTRLEQLVEWRAADLAVLHGVGQKGIRLLDEALRAEGLSFREP